MTVAPIGPNLRSIPTSTEDVDTASALIEFLSQPEFLGEYYKVAIYGPVLKAQETMEACEIPVLAGQLDLVLNGTAPAFPDVNNAAFADFGANFLVPKMVQRIVIDGNTIDEAMDEAQNPGRCDLRQVRVAPRGCQGTPLERCPGIFFESSDSNRSHRRTLCPLWRNRSNPGPRALHASRSPTVRP